MSLPAYDAIVRQHVAKSSRANTHPAKLLVLSSLLKELFGVTLEELIPGIETKLGSKIYGIKGSADLLFLGVIFEVKVNLEAELEDAKTQLKKYFQVLHEQEPGRRHIGIATDVISFRAYIPVLKDGSVTDVQEISSINISSAPSGEFVLWLDSFVFSKPKIRPTAEDLRWRFGPRSPTYSIAIDELTRLWDEVRDEPSVKLKLELWAKNMGIVYGREPEVKSFIDQTYLVTLVKLIVYLRLSGDNTIKPEEIKRAITGEYFASYGILNLIEEDFFIWYLHTKVADRAVKLSCELARELLRYDTSQIDEDLFKEVYQEIVERGQKHRIGEYYTPEWLVELTLKEAVSIWMEKNDKPPRILDPACGSGTFLTNSIHLLRSLFERKGKEEESLDFILSHVIGVDVNPLAVIIARANYLIALGELVRLGRRITIPVYVSDSIRLPEAGPAYAMISGTHVDIYEFTVNKVRLRVPMEVAKHRAKLGEVLSGVREAISAYRLRKNRDEAHGVFRRKVSNLLNAAELEILGNTLDTLLSLVDKGQNEIWAFVLNNIYAPITLMESKFDILASNPPWIAMRYVENKDYQDFLKENVLRYELLGSGETHLFTHMEMATLFFCRTADLYLSDGGVIAFVMPRSILTGASQHARFRSLARPQMKLLKIFDFEDVSPLFNVPACVLLCVKGQAMEYPVLTRRFKGRLDRKNEKLEAAIRSLTVSDYSYEPPRTPIGYSYYHDMVKQGATIVPRNLWFIDFKAHLTLGIDVSSPLVKSSEQNAKEAKEPWKNIELEGNIENDFIYATLLGGDLVPFGYTNLRPVVLPAKPSTSYYILLDVDELRANGFSYMASWLENAQRLWEERRTEKASKDYPRIVSWLDYLGKLSNQNPSSKYVVLYNTSGTNLVSCVVNRHSLPDFRVSGATIRPNGFIAESKTYFYETNDEMEAHYLCAVLNSDVINEAIKPLQSRGLYGERDIHRRPFMLQVPRFDPSNGTHIRLAELSKHCHSRVASVSFTRRSVAGRRAEAKEAIRDEFREINRLISYLLGLTS